jgi:hypothetical protein
MDQRQRRRRRTGRHCLATRDASCSRHVVLSHLLAAILGAAACSGLYQATFVPTHILS